MMLQEETLIKRQNYFLPRTEVSFGSAKGQTSL